MSDQQNEDERRYQEQLRLTQLIEQAKAPFFRPQTQAPFYRPQVQSPFYTPQSQLGQASRNTSPIGSERRLPTTPEQIRFASPYASREVFGSPAPRGSDPFHSFVSPYYSRMPFGSPSGTQTGELSEMVRRRHTAGNLSPTNLSERFGSALSLDSPPISTPLGTPSSAFGQTGPSVWPQQPPLPPPRDPNTNLSSYTPFGNQDTLFSLRSELMSSDSDRARRHSTGDISSEAQTSYDPFSSSDPWPRSSTANPWGQPLQTEPSVRPKVRPPPPSIDNTIPETDIVKKFRNPFTGEPDFSRGIPPLLSRDSRERGIQLANLSRQQTTLINMHRRYQTDRKRGYLGQRGYQRVYDPKEKTERFFTPQEEMDKSSTSLPPLMPRSERDKQMMSDPRFNKPISQIEWKTISAIGPLGRQSYGPPDRRSMSLPDLSSINSSPQTQPQQGVLSRDHKLFEKRYFALKPEHRKTYDEYRKQINWSQNPYALKRRVKPPSLMAIGDFDKKRLKEISSEGSAFSKKPFGNQSEPGTLKGAKRDYIRKRSILPPSLHDEKKKIDWSKILNVSQQIPEEEEEESDEDSDE